MTSAALNLGTACSIRTPLRRDAWATALCAGLLFGGLNAVASAAEYNGELDWANAVTLGLSISGRVAQISVRPGDLVDAGQPLLQLDTRVARAHLAEARSAIKRLELQRAEAQREWDRAKELYDRTVLSERELQLAEIGFNAADAEYHAARSAEVAAEVALEYHTMKAPFAARVLAVHVQAGQAVINTHEVTPLVRLAERDRMRARAWVNAAQAATLKADVAAAVRVGDQRFDAQVASIGADPVGAERPAQYAVEVAFNVPAGTALRAGQAATLVLP
jgi:multidrug efflux system membrane fusion protein